MESSVVAAGGNQQRRKRNMMATATTAASDDQLDGPPKLQRMVGTDEQMNGDQKEVGLEHAKKVSQDENSSKPQQEFDDQLGNDDGLPYTVIEVLDVPQGINPEQLSVYIDDEDGLVIQAEYPGTVAQKSEDDVYGDFDVPDEVKSAIDEVMSYAKMNKAKEPIFRRAIAELLTTNTSVSATWRKYKLNHITLTKYFRLAGEFLKGEVPTLKKGKRLGAKTDAGAYIFRRVLQVPQGVGKETVKCYFEPWIGRLTITAAITELDQALEAHAEAVPSTSKHLYAE